MKRSKWLLMPAVAMMFSVLAGWGAPDGGTTTVGEFALKVSRAMGQRPADQTAAVRGLRKAGVDLGKDLSAGLTLGGAARILRDLGLRVTDPKEPAGQISKAKAAQIVTAVALSLGIVSRLSTLDDPSDCPVSPSDPEDCDDDDDDEGDDDDDDDDDDDKGDDDD